MDYHDILTSMKHLYQSENDSPLIGLLSRETPFEQREERFRLLRLDRFSGPRRQRPQSAHDHWELTAVLDGNGWLCVGEERLPLAENSLALLPPGIRHAEDAPGRMTLIWLGFAARFRPGVLPAQATVLSGAAAPCRELQNFWQYVFHSPDASVPALEGHFLLLLDKVLDSLRRADGKAPDRIDRLLARLHADWNRPLPVEELAAVADWSLGHLHRRFKQATGCSPTEYQIRLRLRQARLLLRESDLAVGEIARACGFRDVGYFSRLFRQRTGLAPAHYRDGSAPPPSQ